MPPAHAPPSQDEITASAMAAVGAAPWDSDPTGWGALCDSKSPCDTIVIDPTVVSLPAQAPAFFVPDHRPPAGVLELAKLDLASLPQRRVVLGSWRECNARRDGKGWTKGRTACVAVGIAGLESARPDAMTFALLVLTPAKGLSWPRIRVTDRKSVV